jgi:hypothetical protein
LEQFDDMGEGAQTARKLFVRRGAERLRPQPEAASRFELFYVREVATLVVLPDVGESSAASPRVAGSPRDAHAGRLYG